MKHNVAVIVGSARKGSINKKLALALQKLGADKLNFTDIAIDTLPMYNQDLEAEKPAAVMAFIEEVKKFKFLLIVTPEHNRSIPALLKNAIDWGSRPAVGGNVWKDILVATAGTSPGAIGTAVGQAHLKQILNVYSGGVMVGELYLQMKDGLIDDNGNVGNPDTEKFLKGYIDKFAAFIDKESAAMKQAA